jgi:hypothetical protein
MAHDVILGRLIDGEQQRDAIHIAVAPVVAAEKLSPGQHIGFVGDDTTKVGVTRTPIGIVDPFVTGMIYPDQKFWMFLYPQTITSLRHDWAHPAFSAVVAADPVAESRAWIEGFAAEIEQTYNRLMEAADLWIEEGDYTYDNSEHYKDHWDKFPEFWKHYEIVTGKKVEDKSDTFFRCSC